MSRKLLALLLAAVAAAGATGLGLTLAWRHTHSATAQHARATPSAQPETSPTDTPQWVPGSDLPRSLQASLDLHSPSAAVPLRFQAPTVGIDVPVEGVGLTSSNAVDAPKGPASSPVWNQAFWYRGGAEPGQPGVFAVAGHVDRVDGGAAAFANLHSIKAGDIVTVVDERSGIAYHYRITETDSYSTTEVNSYPVLARIYGPDVAAGKPPTVPDDMVARISILTCAGAWTGTQYDHRFVAYGELVTGSA
jgi:hypothetical protein